MFNGSLLLVLRKSLLSSGSDAADFRIEEEPIDRRCRGLAPTVVVLVVIHAVTRVVTTTSTVTTKLAVVPSHQTLHGACEERGRPWHRCAIAIVTSPC